MTSRSLEGVRVLELARYQAGLRGGRIMMVRADGLIVRSHQCRLNNGYRNLWLSWR